MGFHKEQQTMVEELVGMFHQATEILLAAKNYEKAAMFCRGAAQANKVLEDMALGNSFLVDMELGQLTRTWHATDLPDLCQTIGALLDIFRAASAGR